MEKPKLLYYLDDDRDDLYFFKNATGSLGHRVRVFSDGYELLQTLRNNPEKPDLIFLDMHMPVMNGEEILNIIKKSGEYKQIPIVMISGAYPKKLVRQLMAMGADYLMKKPGRHGDLKAEIEKVVAMLWNPERISA
jgi:CheY-like chemotaxis protein